MTNIAHHGNIETLHFEAPSVKRSKRNALRSRSEQTIDKRTTLQRYKLAANALSRQSWASLRRLIPGYATQSAASQLSFYHHSQRDADR